MLEHCRREGFQKKTMGKLSVGKYSRGSRYRGGNDTSWTRDVHTSRRLENMKRLSIDIHCRVEGRHGLRGSLRIGRAYKHGAL